MTPTFKQILQVGNGLEDKYVPNLDDLNTVIKNARLFGFSVVLTQGVYDMFHVGHLRYLEAASKFGDLLVVGVDTDELTRETKGKIDPSRPFDRFEDRVELIGSLHFVRVVTRRHTDQHTDDLIKLVRPDVLVISKTTSSFNPEKVEELSSFCGRIEHLEAKANPSTTSTTARVSRLRGEGARILSDAILRVVKEHVGDSNGS